MGIKYHGTRILPPGTPEEPRRNPTGTPLEPLQSRSLSRKVLRRSLLNYAGTRVRIPFVTVSCFPWHTMLSYVFHSCNTSSYARYSLNRPPFLSTNLPIRVTNPLQRPSTSWHLLISSTIRFNRAPWASRDSSHAFAGTDLASRCLIHATDVSWSVSSWRLPG